jgi:ribosomal protein L40E|tara:strand:+ start:183 stop:446 length:264 start_codon:yes stop_codon:yes gene_type:complete
MTWEDIIKNKRKRYPTTAQKKNRNWNNLSDEEKLQVRMKRSWKGATKRRDNEIREAKICSKCGKKDNPPKSRFCVKCGNKMKVWWKE